MIKKKILPILSALMILFVSCSLQSNQLQNEDSVVSTESRGSTTVSLPKSRYAACVSNTNCVRYRMPLDYTVRTLSRKTVTATISGKDCYRCSYSKDHEVTWTETRYLKKCSACGYHSGSTLEVTITKCSYASTPSPTRITGFKIIPHENPSAPVVYAVWNPVNNAVKYTVKTKYIYNSKTYYNTTNYTKPKVGLYKPHSAQVLSIKAYNSYDQVIAYY